MEVQKILGINGRIFGSKSSYRLKHPNDFILFNANVCIEKEKIWYGDLNLTLDKKKLQKLAKELNENIYVFYEMDARFENENKFNIEKAVIEFLSNGEWKIREDLQEFYSL